MESVEGVDWERASGESQTEEAEGVGEGGREAAVVVGSSEMAWEKALERASTDWKRSSGRLARAQSKKGCKMERSGR